MSETSDSESETSTASQVWRDSLLQCLYKVKSTGDFAVSTRHTAFPNPGLQIEGNRNISLPLTSADAAALKTVATQATYGAGDQNIVDTTVRKTWELQPSAFQLTNPEWEAYFTSHVLRRAADGLGLQKVTALPHKLLLYEPGSFFKRHKDSETEEGMVGTIVVCLPSQHQGGHVRLSFHSEERTLATDTTSAWDLTALAWFADVTHEVAELTDGHRLVLTYKIVQTAGPVESAQFLHRQREGLLTVLAGWNNAEPTTQALYYPLDHLYSGCALAVDKLKGRDGAVCRLLHDACSDTDVLVFLAHIAHTQWWDDYGEPGEQTALQQVYTCDGKRVSSSLRADQEGILRADAFDRDPDSESEGGYRTGRDHVQGNSRYYSTVAMLIPRRGLHIFAVRSWCKEEQEFLVAIVDEQLRNHRDAAVEAAAATVFNSAVGGRPAPPAVVHTIFCWALELNNENLFRHVGTHGLMWVDSQEAILGVIGRRLQDLCADDSEVIKWETWFDYFAQHCSLATWQRIVEQFPSHLESQHLRDSFTAWGEDKMDAKFKSQAQLSCNSARFKAMFKDDFGDDGSFLIKSIESRPAGSEWITTDLLPSLASRGSRELLYRMLDVFFTRRESEHFSFAQAAFEYVFQHAQAKLVLRATDVNYGNTKEECKAFVTLLDQCLTIGASTQAMQLLEASAHKLKGKLRKESWYSPQHCEEVVAGLLVPLVVVLEKHGVSNFRHAAKTFFVTVIGEHLLQCLHRSANWVQEQHRCEAEQCSLCDALGRFLGSRTDRTWRFAADETSREHIEHVLSAHGACFKLTTEGNTSPSTLVVVKSRPQSMEDVKRYNMAVESSQAALAPLKGDTMRPILGDECYRDMICLEDMKVEDDAKRQADEEVGGVAKKLKIAERSKRES